MRRSWLHFLPMLTLAVLSHASPAFLQNPLTSFSTVDDVCDVRSFGAVGDGVVDDTQAFQRAFADCAGRQVGTVWVPSGNFLITSTIVTTAQSSLQVVGQGWTSNILWAHDGDLFSFNMPEPMTHSSFREIAVSSINIAKSANSTAFSFPQGIVKSLFDRVMLNGNGAIPNATQSAVLVGSGFDLGTVTDTVTIRECLMWFLVGTGVKVGHGSEVRISNGRIIGNGFASGSIGVHVTGNNGGVHLDSTDVISHSVGMQLDASNGAGSNREIFLSHATLDSNGRGLAVLDDSYVSVAGCWAASSTQDNIWLAPSAKNALLVIAGGTIFNAGAIGGDCANGQCNGITVNAGSFSLSGVAIRNNKGHGVWVPTASVGHFTINGCNIFSNGIAATVDGGGYTFVGNVLHGNTQPGTLSKAGGAVIANNIIS